MRRVLVGVVSAFVLLILAAVLRNFTQHEVRNVIVMIGDGMGLTEVAYTDLRSDDPLFIERVETMGLVRTHSASHRVTDSAAAATAFACGVKSRNGVIGMDADLNAVESILERAERAEMSTGVVATYSVTHATPAGFLAHTASRNNAERIAEDIVKSGVDLFIAGGRDFFEQRADSVNLSDKLRSKGYNVVYDIDSAEQSHDTTPLAAMLAPNGLPSMLEGRGDMLPRATAKALTTLHTMAGERGFFLMVEGSQIDGMGHKNSAEGIVAETIDFDVAVQRAFDFADVTPKTLVIVFADHETGGLTMPADGTDIAATFSTHNHTGVMVPIYAYGAGAEQFAGVMDNTEIPQRIAAALGIEW